MDRVDRFLCFVFWFGICPEATEHRVYPGRRFGISGTGIVWPETDQDTQLGRVCKTRHAIDAALLRQRRLRPIALRFDDGQTSGSRVRSQQQINSPRRPAADPQGRNHDWRIDASSRVRYRCFWKVGLRRTGIRRRTVKARGESLLWLQLPSTRAQLLSVLLMLSLIHI